MNQYMTAQLFDLKHTIAAEYLAGFTWPWEALAGIRDLIVTLGEALPETDYEEISEHVWVARSARVAPTAFLGGPVIVGPEAEIRHCAFVRGSALIGEHTVVGNSTELKNVILFDHVEVPHYNYVGDSILGFHAHMGAGSITSNIKADRKNILIHFPEGSVETGLRKIGAMLGDWTEIGCNSVLNPGTVIGRGTQVYPLSMVRGTVPAGSIYKKAGEIIEKAER